MILYVENSKGPPKNCYLMNKNQLSNEHIHDICKIENQYTKCVAFNTVIMSSGKEINKTIPFAIAPKE